jgi:hypothetical protein
VRAVVPVVILALSSTLAPRVALAQAVFGLESYLDGAAGAIAAWLGDIRLGETAKRFEVICRHEEHKYRERY